MQEVTAKRMKSLCVALMVGVGVIFTGNVRQELHVIVTGQHIGRFEDASGCGTRVQGLRAQN